MAIVFGIHRKKQRDPLQRPLHFSKQDVMVAWSRIVTVELVKHGWTLEIF